jgi:hypothetical protein
MKIQVTLEHIDKGREADGEFCPLALAIKSHFNEPIFIYCDRINFRERKQGLIYVTTRPPIQLPYEARSFYHRFDRGDKVTPFEFEIPDALS